MIENKQNNCAEFVNQLRALDFSQMLGAAEHCNSEQLLSSFPAMAKTPGRGLLGQKRRPTTFWLSDSVSGFCSQLRIWFLEDEILRLDLDFPLSFNWQQQSKDWGEPQARQDYYYDNMLLNQLAYVWLQRGISFLFNAEKSAIIQVLIYQPCSLEHYNSEIFLSLPTREINRE